MGQLSDYNSLPGQVPFARAEIRRRGEDLSIWVTEEDGQEKELLPMAYMSYLPPFADYEGFRRAGYRLLSVCAYMSDLPINETTDIQPFDGHLWVSPDRFDFAPLDAAIGRALGQSAVPPSGGATSETDGGEPPCFIILRLNLNMPRWWREMHPEELTLLADGSVYMQSVFSPVWLADAKRCLDAVCAHLTREGIRQVIGIQLAAMNTEEWLAITGPGGSCDVSAPALSCFRADMEMQYRTVDALNRAWGTDFPSFSAVTPPDPALRAAVEGRPFMDEPADPASVYVTDWLRTFNRGFARAITALAAHLKTITAGRMLVGCFYGYIGQLPAVLGHACVLPVLNSPDIDFMASPFPYVDARHTAKDWYFHGAMDSFRRHGKLWFMEADIRTCLSRKLKDCHTELLAGATTTNYDHPVWVGPDSEVHSLWHMTRAFGKIALAHHGFWWFDMWGGWYRREAFMAFAEKAACLFADLWRTPTSPGDHPRVAVFLDWMSAYSLGSLYGQMINCQMIEWGHIGCPYDVYLPEDLPALPHDRYDLYLFPAPVLNRRAQDPDDPVIPAMEALIHDGKFLMITGNQTVIPPSPRVLTRRDSLFTWQETAAAARAAGIHLYTADGSLIYANRRFLCVTATWDGLHTVDTGRACLLRDAFTGEVFPAPEGRATVSLACDQTRLWEICAPEDE